MNALSTTQVVAAVLMTVLLLCSPVVSGATAAADDPSPDDVDVDHIYMHVDVDDDGNATWVVEHRMLLTYDDDRALFESIEGDVAENPDEYETEFSQYTNSVFVDATENVDREMSIEHRSVDTRTIRNSYGVVRYEFTWSNFAEVSETDTVRTQTIGDTMETLRLGADTRIDVSWDGAYSMQSVTPTPDDNHVQNQVTWSGPIEFNSEQNEPRVTIERDLVTETPTPEPPTEEPPTEPPSEENPVVDSAMAALIALGILALGVAALAVYTRTSDDPDDESELASLDESAVEASSDDGGESAATDEPDEPEVDLDLLSNEEQVLHLLTQNNGRLKQQDIVSKTEWSAAKTSNVVNQMKDDGSVDVFRVGRENVVVKPDSADEGEPALS